MEIGALLLSESIPNDIVLTDVYRHLCYAKQIDPMLKKHIDTESWLQAMVDEINSFWDKYYYGKHLGSRSISNNNNIIRYKNQGNFLVNLSLWNYVIDLQNNDKLDFKRRLYFGFLLDCEENDEDYLLNDFEHFPRLVWDYLNHFERKEIYTHHKRRMKNEQQRIDDIISA